MSLRRVESLVLKLKVQELGYRVQGFRFRVQGFGFGIEAVRGSKGADFTCLEHARDAMCGTERGCDDRRMLTPSLVAPPLSPYACPAQCPVLTYYRPTRALCNARY